LKARLRCPWRRTFAHLPVPSTRTGLDNSCAQVTEATRTHKPWSFHPDHRSAAFPQLPYQVDMQTSRRRCAQTAHISLQHFNFQRAQTQNKQHTRTSGVSAVVHPEFPRSVAATPVPSSPLPRPVRLGEAVFRPGARKLQAKKTCSMTFSCQSLQKLEI